MVELVKSGRTTERIPYLGYGARPTLDHAAKIALLMSNEGAHEGRQLLHRGKIREALGRTEWRGFQVDPQVRYRHAFWRRSISAGACRAEVSYMQGYGANHTLLLRSGVILFRFMDDFDEVIVPLVRSVERVKSSCDED